jgi:surface protein
LITDIGSLFKDKSDFNDDISGWDVLSVTNMSYMFYYASSFNQPLGSWDVSSVTSNIEDFVFEANGMSQEFYWQLHSETVCLHIPCSPGAMWHVKQISTENSKYSPNSLCIPCPMEHWCLTGYICANGHRR